MDDMTLASVARRPQLPTTAGPDDPAMLAERRLRGHPYLALRNVSCECRGGVLTLRGCLPSYYLKQVAQAAAASVDGVAVICKEIEVVPAPRRWE